MKKADADCAGAIAHIADADVDREDKIKQLQFYFGRRSDEAAGVIDFVLNACEAFGQLRLANGPCRPATFLRLTESGHPVAQGLVVFGDGQELFARLDAELARRLTPGDAVIVNNQGSIIGRDGNRPFAGDICVFERPHLPGMVLVRNTSSNDLVAVSLAAPLRKKIEQGSVKPGHRLIADAKVAYDHIPEEESTVAHFRYLDTTPIPSVTLADVAAPNRLITDVVEYLSQELHPEKRRKYGLPRSFFGLAVGPPGVGKSHSLLALGRHIYEHCSHLLGLPLSAIKSRCLTLSVASVISKYLGESDLRISEFQREVVELARRPVEGADGKEHLLPTYVRIEELDSIARRRSDSDFDGGAMDRILMTLLTLFDPAREEFQNLQIIVLCTTNRADVIDPAAIRRLGMATYRFGRLTENRRAFEAVLTTQLTKVPVAGNTNQTLARATAVSEISAWLFSDRDQDPIVDLAYVGSAEVVTKVRRHFISHGLINRAVIAAAAEACAREIAGLGPDGVQAAELMAQLDVQVRNIVDLLRPENTADHLDLPDGVRVATVKRRPKPLVQAFEAVRMRTAPAEVAA